MTMTDSQNQAQISEERERRLKQIDEKEERFLKQYEEQKERHLKLMREYYALNLDALKVMGGGNAAGLVAAAAALKMRRDVALCASPKAAATYAITSGAKSNPVSPETSTRASACGSSTVQATRPSTR